MRQLQTQEIQNVSGAGLLFGTLKFGVKAGAAVVQTGAQAAGALGTGIVQAGAIVVKPVATGAWNLFKFLV